MGGNIRGLLKIGDGSRNPQDAGKGPGGKSQFVNSPFKKHVGIMVNNTIFFDLAVAHLGIAVNPCPFQSLRLYSAGSIYPLPDIGRGLRFVLTGQVPIANRRHLYMDINAIHQGTGNL